MNPKKDENGYENISSAKPWQGRVELLDLTSSSVRSNQKPTVKP